MKRYSKMAFVGMCAAFALGGVFAIILGVVVGIGTAGEAMTGSKVAGSVCAAVALLASVGGAFGAAFCLIDRLEETLAARIGAWVRS